MTESIIILMLQTFRFQVEHSPGHSHLYAPFDSIIAAINSYRKDGLPLQKVLAGEILLTVDLLIRESSVGRRPWSPGWEDYFEKCLRNAHLLLSVYCQFENYRLFLPAGFCNCLSFALALDRHADGLPDGWYRRYMSMTLLASEMFKWTADENAQVDRWLLENENDDFFTNIVTGYARSGKAEQLLLEYTKDDEGWVRNLAKQLLETYYR